MIEALNLYRRLWVYIRPYRWRILLSVLASWGVAACDGTMAKMVQPFVDRLVVNKEQEMVILVPFIILALQLGKAVFRYVQEYFVRTAGQLAIQNIRNDVFSHSMQLSMGYHTRTPTGVLMSKVMNDVGVLQNSLAEVLVGLMRDAVTLVALTVVAFYTDWRMAGIAFLVLPLAAWPASAIGRKIKHYSRSGQGVTANLTTVLEQSFSGVKVIKAFGTEAQEIAKFSEENRSLYRLIRKVLKYDSAAAPFIEALAGMGAAAVIWFGMERVMSGGMTVGELFTIMAAIMLMYTPFKRLTRLNNYLQQASSAAERVFAIIDEPLEIAEARDAVDLGRARGEVAFEHVTFAYDGEAVLRDFNLSASPGEVIALVGPSGAGKTTVAGLLSRFYDPQEGRVCIDGHDLRSLTLASLRRNMALVDQETFLFNDTIANNIRYAVPQASDEQVREAARQAYADEFISQLPEGYQTSIGDRGLRLSGGQRQRLCIARALLTDAPVLILDEATSALDTESEAMVQKALQNLMRNRTTLVIAHRLSTIMNANRIVVMEAGCVRESGTHQQLIASSGLYRKLYEMQFQDRE